MWQIYEGKNMDTGGKLQHKEILADTTKEESRLLQATCSAAFLKRHELHHATGIYFNTFNRKFFYLCGFFLYFLQFSFQPQQD